MSRAAASQLDPPVDEALDASSRPAIRLARARKSRVKVPRTAKPDEARVKAEENLRLFRQRQASVTAIIEKTFGTLGDEQPALWERRAYLMLVGMVYERLAIHEDELPTAELVALAKILAESRRAQNQKQEALEPAPLLEEQVETAVREVYGVQSPPT